VYQFFVRARDHGEPAFENHVPVEILIMGAGDSPPVFPSAQRSFFIQEDEPAGGVIATLKARHADPLSYALIPGMTNSSNKWPTFAVNDQGEIRLLRSLDRERTPAYSLTLRAQTRTKPPLVDYVTVQVQLRDINDNAPKFESRPYTATVLENAPVGTDIIQVEACCCFFLCVKNVFSLYFTSFCFSLSLLFYGLCEPDLYQLDSRSMHDGKWPKTLEKYLCLPHLDY
jgi:protocadherin Fat 1/2/3